MGLASPKRLSPLSIVAIFVSLAQSISAIALLQTTGNIQLYLTYFVTMFPVGVAVGFFVILVKKHKVFYAPWEYGGVDEMREFLGEQPKPTDESKFKDILQRKVETGVIESALPNDKNVVKNIMQNIQEAFLNIDTTPLVGKKGSSWVKLYEEFDTVQDLLNHIYSYIREIVPPYSYGKKWLLRDKETSKVFQDMGYNMDIQRGTWKIGSDNRGLEDVGIKPGMHLQVIPA